MMRPRALRRCVLVSAGIVLTVVLLWPRGATAQAEAPAASGGQQAPANQQRAEPALRFRMPTIYVFARKEPEDKQALPVSVTAVPRDTIESAGMRIVSDAALFAPNTFFTESTARKLSDARFRGISSSPTNPGITTYIDGVPQLNINSSSIELLDVDQIEFVRGPQSALFGRNTLGGLVNVMTSRPSQSGWTGTFSAPVGNHGAWGVRGEASGPVVADRVSAGIAFAQMDRDGFTMNDVTRHVVDNRSAFSAKGQVLLTPADRWEARVIVTGERARDGDYALHDVVALRANPFHAARDFEGHVDRDVVATTVHARRAGDSIVLSTTTGLVRWKTVDATDLDYSPVPLVTRDNTEEDIQFTQEVRLASSGAASAGAADRTTFAWQTGVFFFTQAYDQDAINTLAPFVITPFAVSMHSPRAELDDVGVGLFGQGTVTFNDRVDLTVGARLDHERKEATLATFSEPLIALPTEVVADESFSNVSPQLAIAYRMHPERMLYATAGRGFKAGGFNPASPSGREAYGEEQTWLVEGGVKTGWAGGRAQINAAVFYIDWTDLQLNVSNPEVPGQFFVTNIGGATSTGVELETSARLVPGVDVFSAIGYADARFSEGSLSEPVSLKDNQVPFTPDYTASAGVHLSRTLSPSLTLYGHLEAVFYGSFQYSEMNDLGQDAYSLANLRGGVRGRYLFAEVWTRNAFDTRYVPFAFPFSPQAPSGFIGELGPPRTFGVGGGVRF